MQHCTPKRTSVFLNHDRHSAQSAAATRELPFKIPPTPTVRHSDHPPIRYPPVRRHRCRPPRHAPPPRAARNRDSALPLPPPLRRHCVTRLCIRRATLRSSRVSASISFAGCRDSCQRGPSRGPGVRARGPHLPSRHPGQQALRTRPCESVGESSNGRTTDSDSVYLGSNPSSPTNSRFAPFKLLLMNVIARSTRCVKPMLW
jgi:hypothetical protein